jgi:hypothetical protein
MAPTVVTNPLPKTFLRLETKLPDACPGCGESVGPATIEGVYYVWACYEGTINERGCFEAAGSETRLPQGSVLGPYPAYYRCASCGGALTSECADG